MNRTITVKQLLNFLNIDFNDDYFSVLNTFFKIEIDVVDIQNNDFFSFYNNRIELVISHVMNQYDYDFSKKYTTNEKKELYKTTKKQVINEIDALNTQVKKQISKLTDDDIFEFFKK